MPNVVLFNMEGKELGNYELNDAIFGIKPSMSAIHTVVVSHLANKRQGTQSALTRAEVRGGGIKPWRQKGTGRARQGSTRAPQWTGGGVVFAPKPRTYKKSVNRKIKALAMKSALSSKVADNNLLLLDTIAFEEIKTKKAAQMLKDLKVETKALVVLAEKDENVYRSVKNIEGASTTFVGELNVYEMLKYDKLIMTKGAVEKLEEVYA